MEKLSVFLFALCFLLLSSSSAHAYLDPASSSFILQIILASIAGFVVMLKIYWHRFLALFGIDKKKVDDKKANESQ